MDIRSADGPGREPYETLYEEDACGRLSVLPRGEIVRINRTLLGWIGYSEAEALGRRFSSLLTVASALLYETHCAPLLGLRGSISEIALELKTRGGSPLSVLLSAVARRDASGAPTLIRISVMSAPTRRQYERELLRAREEAEDAAEQLRALRDLAERKVAEQDALLESVRRMASGDLLTPVPIDAGSSLAVLAGALERMRHDVLGTIRQMDERNAEVLQLNRELRRQIEQRSSVFAETMLAMGGDYSTAELQPLFGSGMVLAGRYRVDSLLGQGAMGTVYQVERLSDGRALAAKVLNIKPDYRAMARFAREAQLLARLHHPNLIGIVDIDVTKEHVAYIVMELARGRSLAELGARYGDQEFMLAVLHQILGALVAVHAAGIVHRDIKPGNVLISLDADGVHATAKLVDFGVSRLLDTAQEDSDPSYLAGAKEDGLLAGLSSGLGVTQDGPLAAPAVHQAEELPGTLTVDSRIRPLEAARGFTVLAPPSPPPDEPREQKRRSSSSDELTQAGAVLGTPLYMAPELASGARNARLPADIFSFGVMAYEVLTGSLPFAQPPPLLAAHANGKLSFTPLDAACPTLPASVVRALEASLAVDPAHRPTAAELFLVLASSIE